MSQEKTRSSNQNKALHKWLDELALELNNRGLDMRTVLKPEVEIPWDGKLLKKHVFHPIEEAMLEKTSTADLTTSEVSKVVDVINRHLLQKFDVSLPFPSEEMRNLVE